MAAALYAGQLYDSLQHAQRLLVRVSNMGPLVSLLKAAMIREEFLRVNRDLTCAFNILAAGEQLLVSLAVPICIMLFTVSMPKLYPPRSALGAICWLSMLPEVALFFPLAIACATPAIKGHDQVWLHKHNIAA